MIFEGEKPNYFEVIDNSETKKTLCCKHDFWEQIEEMDFGDIALCQRCCQYFTKVKHMLWLVRSKEVPSELLPQGIRRVRTKPLVNHKNLICIVRVPVRITDDKN
jgi:hypothetical protein